MWVEVERFESLLRGSWQVPVRQRSMPRFLALVLVESVALEKRVV